MNIVDDFFKDEENNLNIKETNIEKKSLDTSSKSKQGLKNGGRRIAVHCVAGLGRAPLLVAIALVHKGCRPENAIELIRQNRKGAFNLKQAEYIMGLKAKEVDKSGSTGCCGENCIIF